MPAGLRQQENYAQVRAGIQKAGQSFVCVCVGAGRNWGGTVSRFVIEVGSVFISRGSELMLVCPGISVRVSVLVCPTWTLSVLPPPPHRKISTQTLSDSDIVQLGHTLSMLIPPPLLTEKWADIGLPRYQCPCVCPGLSNLDIIRITPPPHRKISTQTLSDLNIVCVTPPPSQKIFKMDNAQLGVEVTRTIVLSQGNSDNSDNCLYYPNSVIVWVRVVQTMSKSDNIQIVWVTLTQTMSNLGNVWVVWVTLTQTMSKLAMSKLSESSELPLCRQCPSWTMSKLSELPQCRQCASWTLSKLDNVWVVWVTLTQCPAQAGCPSYRKTLHISHTF